MAGFLVSYILPLMVINGLVFAYLKLFRNKYLTHFYIYLLVEVVYIISMWPQIANPSLWTHYVHLADALLHGRWHLDFTPGYHDVSFFNDQYFVSQPFLPSILMMPFVFFYGTGFNDILFTIVFSAINCAILYNVILSLNKATGKEVVTNSIALFLTFFFAFGTVVWTVTVPGSVWHTAHIIALLFVLLALNEILTGKRYFLAGLFASTAIAARPSVYWAFPFFIIIAIHDYLLKKDVKTFFIKTGFFIIPYFIWAFILGLVNYLRFGNPFEFGFASMNHAVYLQERLDKYGTLNLHFLAENCNIAFIKFFNIVKKFPFLKPSGDGLSMFVTSPLLFYMFRPFSKGSMKTLVKRDFAAFFNDNYIATGAIVSSICTAIPLLLYFNSGWMQFGYRYILDYIPFLIILVAYGMKKKISIPATVLFMLSYLVMLYGVIVYIRFPAIF